MPRGLARSKGFRAVDLGCAYRLAPGLRHNTRLAMAAESGPTRKPWQYILLSIITVSAVSYQTLATSDIIQDWDENLVMQLPSLQVSATSRRVLAMDPALEKAGLRVGDEIVSISGVEFRGFSIFQRLQGESARLGVNRGGQPIIIEAPLVTAQSSKSTTQARLLSTILFGIMPWLCIALGVWAVALRPWDRQAWLLLVFADSGASGPLIPVSSGPPFR